MFRLKENVPQIYVKESRDFQLFCNTFDAAVNAVKFDIDTILTTLDANTCLDRVLMLLSEKVGFSPKHKYDSNLLKYIIAAFPYIIKHKGTTVGIKGAVNTILKAEKTSKTSSDIRVEIVSKSKSELQEDYTVYIYTEIDLYNKIALDDLLSYVLPLGYTYKIIKYVPSSSVITDEILLSKNSIKQSDKKHTTDTSIVHTTRPINYETDDNKLDFVTGRIDTMQVVGYRDLTPTTSTTQGDNNG